MADEFPDWRRAPNIGENPDIYELENDAIARDGRLDDALRGVANWAGRDILDIGCGTGYWLPAYASDAATVVGVEPDPSLRKRARSRIVADENVSVVAGSAEHLPVADDSFDIAHARFAYFFGPGSERGLEEVRRVLRRGGVFIVVDNSWSGGDFAKLLRIATEGNAAIDPDATATWWAERGATKHEIEAAWVCKSAEELESILRIEFAGDVVDRFLAEHDGGATISYRYLLYEWSPG